MLLIHIRYRFIYCWCLGKEIQLEDNLTFLVRLEICMSYDPSIPLLGLKHTLKKFLFKYTWRLV